MYLYPRPRIKMPNIGHKYAPKTANIHAKALQVYNML